MLPGKKALQGHRWIGQCCHIYRLSRLDQCLAGANLAWVVRRGDADDATVSGQVHGSKYIWRGVCPYNRRDSIGW
jgi:hypothetical protein